MILHILPLQLIRIGTIDFNCYLISQIPFFLSHSCKNFSEMQTIYPNFYLISHVTFCQNCNFIFHNCYSSHLQFVLRIVTFSHKCYLSAIYRYNYKKLQLWEIFSYVSYNYRKLLQEKNKFSCKSNFCFPFLYLWRYVIMRLILFYIFSFDLMCCGAQT